MELTHLDEVGLWGGTAMAVGRSALSVCFLTGQRYYHFNFILTSVSDCCTHISDVMIGGILNSRKSLRGSSGQGPVLERVLWWCEAPV